jgi:chemotaxis protein MotB
MRQVLIALVILVCLPGCAISEIKRINQKLKDENDRLLMENRDLRSQAQIAQKGTEDKQVEIENLRKELATAQRGSKEPSTPAEGAQIKASSFKDLEDVDVIEEKGTIRLVLSDRVFFTPGNTNINPKGKSVLDKVASILKRDYPGATVRVDGHTDSTPIAKSKDKYASNWELSTDRACAVTRYLVDRGVDPKKIYAAGFAFNRPVASNDTPAGREKNRRVEIVVVR